MYGQSLRDLASGLPRLGSGLDLARLGLYLHLALLDFVARLRCRPSSAIEVQYVGGLGAPQH